MSDDKKTDEKVEEKEIDANDPNHPIRKPETAFSVGEEVVLEDGTVAKVVDFKDGKYFVAYRKIAQFDEANLKKVE